MLTFASTIVSLNVKNDDDDDDDESTYLYNVLVLETNVFEILQFV